MAILKKVAVWKFASCDGCQLSLMDLEDEFLPLTEKIKFSYFLEATSHNEPGPYDLSLVEGSISTPEDLRRIQEVRANSKYLVTIGACANAGGIQALRNFANVDEYLAIVYAHPEYIATLSEAKPASSYVTVDFELRGCPINKYQLLDVIMSFLHDKPPAVANESVCMECKRRGQVCVLVASGTPCLGPITHAGCGAICPNYQRGCYGCYGAKETANPASLSKKMLSLGSTRKELLALYRNFNATDPVLAVEAKKYDGE